MKKLLAIVVLGLLLTSCSKKVDKALEKCADVQTIMSGFTYLKTEFKKLIVDRTYQKTDEIVEGLKTELRENEKKRRAEELKWKKNNPRPKYPTFKQTQEGYTVAKYNNLIAERRAELRKQTNEYRASSNEIKNKIDEVEKYQLIIVRKRVREELERISLKEKSKIKGYNDNFEKCEKAHQKTPKSFMLEWSK